MKFKGNRKFEYRTIRWTIVEFCNYHCPYCSTISQKFSSKDICLNWKDIVEYINRYKIKYIKFYGGEPTLHPDILDIVSSINEKVGFYSNISRSLSFWKEIIKFNKLLDLNCSLHFNEVKDIDEFCSKIHFLSKKTRIYVNVLLENKNIYDIVKYFNEIRKIIEGTNSRVTLSKVVGSKNYYKNIDINEFKEFLNETQYIEVIKNKHERISEYNFTEDNIDTFNFTCDMRKYFLSLDKEGNFTNFCLNGKITDIYENQPELLIPKTILCRYKNSCLMHYLMIGEKVKLNNEY